MELTAPPNKKISKNGVAQNALVAQVKHIYVIQDIYKVEVYQLVAILHLFDVE